MKEHVHYLFCGVFTELCQDLHINIYTFVLTICHVIIKIAHCYTLKD